MPDTTGLHLRLKRNLCIVYCCMILVIYAPICMYGIIKFYKLRNNIILEKRHSLITIYLLICALLLMTIFIPLIMVAFSNSSVFINLDVLKWHNYGIYTFYPVIIFFLQSIYIFIWRQWLYYYDIKFIKAASNKQWTQLIDPVFHKNNWFLNISNRKKFGTHASFMFYKIMLLLFTLTTISEIIWPIIFDASSVIMFAGTMFSTFFWFTLCIFALLILKIKTPSFQDAFYIGAELKYWIYIMGISTIIIVITLLLDYFAFDSSKLHVIITLTNYYLMCTSICILICISSLWIIYKNKVTNDIDEKLKINFGGTLAVAGRSVELMSLSKSEEIKDTITSNSNLLDILKNDRLFDEFMLHLMREFSLEVMLSLIEFSQFQRNVFEFAQTITAFEYDDNFVPVDDEWRIKFDFFVYPTSVPNSSIVYGPLGNDEIALCKHLASNNINKMEMKIELESDDDKHYLNTKKDKDKEIDYDTEIQKIEFLIRSHKLYSKYISVGSELEINLSFKHRNALIEQMSEFGTWVNLNNEHNKQLNILFQLFEECMKEMYTLLNYSFSRFKTAWVNENI
eukprot:334193_1